jgi:hypothetical protein
MPIRLQMVAPHGLALVLAGGVAGGMPVLALAQTDTAVEAATAQLDAQSDQWMLDHLAIWLRANGCTISKDRQQDFEDGVLGLVLDGLQVPPELQADLIPAADDRMQRAAEAWEASGKTIEDLGLFMSEDGETLRLDPC